MQVPVPRGDDTAQIPRNMRSYHLALPQSQNAHERWMFRIYLGHGDNNHSSPKTLRKEDLRTALESDENDGKSMFEARERILRMINSNVAFTVKYFLLKHSCLFLTIPPTLMKTRQYPSFFLLGIECHQAFLHEGECRVTWGKSRWECPYGALASRPGRSSHTH